MMGCLREPIPQGLAREHRLALEFVNLLVPLPPHLKNIKSMMSRRKEEEICVYPTQFGGTNATPSRAHFHPSLWSRRGVAVGMPVARHPPRRSVRALVSAHGSYLGCVWRQSELVDTDEGCAVQGSIAGRVARSATCSAGAGRSDGVTTTASDGSPARETARGCNCSPVRHDS